MSSEPWEGVGAAQRQSIGGHSHQPSPDRGRTVWSVPHPTGLRVPPSSLPLTLPRADPGEGSFGVPSRPWRRFIWGGPLRISGYSGAGTKEGKGLGGVWAALPCSVGQSGCVPRFLESWLIAFTKNNLRHPW